jgi:hypothetical protein
MGIKLAKVVFYFCLIAVTFMASKYIGFTP